MTENIGFKILTRNAIDEMAVLALQLNAKLTVEEAKNYFTQMFDFGSYTCFGVFIDDKLVGISSAWTSVKLYSGKQLEVDNVIIDNSLQSKGLGKKFFDFIESWAKENEYKTIELNTYVQNPKSHKFYFNLGYSILAFHFWKQI